jgi:hypothetical protein
VTSPLYAHSIEEGAALVERIRSEAGGGDVKPIGFDTEFYDVRIGEQSTVSRAKVHFASLAWAPRGAKFHPRGYPVPHSAVVSREVVTSCRPFREFFLDRGYRFIAHNAPVDVHTFGNEGIEIANVVNTLTLARWVYPGRARTNSGRGGFTLDALGQDLLGAGKLEDFKELFRERREDWVERTVTSKTCACGVLGCRKRAEPLHSKHLWTETIREPLYVEAPVPLEAVVPGHALFDRAINYAAQDAVLAFGLWFVLNREMTKQERNVPWL